MVAIIELKKRSDSHEEATDELAVVKREVTSAISNSHGLGVADLVLVPCVEQYGQGQFGRLDA